MILLISLAAAFVFFLFIATAVVVAAKKRKSVSDRIQFYSGYSPQVEAPAPRVTWKENIRRVLAEKQRRVARRQKLSKLDLKMQRADLPLTGKEFLQLIVIAIIVVWLILSIAGVPTMNAYFVGIVVGAAMWVAVDQRIKRRREQFVSQLTDCLTLLANAMRAGFSFMQAMELISREMKPPISEEFERVMRETNVGKPLDQALTELDDRIGSPDFSLVITAVLVQQQVGGNLAEVLDIIHNTINERIRIRREIHTLTSQGRATGIVLACIPVAMFIFFMITAPEYIAPLLNTTLGRLCIGGALIMEVVGYFIIKKIVDIKV